MNLNSVCVLLLAACATGSGCAPSAVPPPAAGDSEYVFVPNTERYVKIIRGDLCLVGKLDADGNFLEDPRFRHKADEPQSSTPASELINDCGYTPSGQEAPRPVYEYRSGRLIKGVIDKKGNFVPDMGPTVILFKDYRYSPGVPEIWNLPGWFVKKSELKEFLKRRQ